MAPRDWEARLASRDETWEQFMYRTARMTARTSEPTSQHTNIPVRPSITPIAAIQDDGSRTNTVTQHELSVSSSDRDSILKPVTMPLKRKSPLQESSPKETPPAKKSKQEPEADPTAMPSIPFISSQSPKQMAPERSALLQLSSVIVPASSPPARNLVPVLPSSPLEGISEFTIRDSPLVSKNASVTVTGNEPPSRRSAAVAETSSITSPSKSPSKVSTVKVSSHGKKTGATKVLKPLPKPPPIPCSVPPVLPAAKQKTKPKGKRKAQEPKLLPEQYAEYLAREGPSPVLPPPLPENATPGEARKHRDKILNSTYLKDYRIFYASNDYSTATETTRERMKMMCRHGATLVAKYHPDEVTHIVTDDVLSINGTLKRLGVKNLKEVPDHIPIIRWSWINTNRLVTEVGPDGKDVRVVKMGSVFVHAAFDCRKYEGSELPKPTVNHCKRESKKSIVDAGNESQISNFTEDPSPSATTGLNQKQAGTGFGSRHSLARGGSSSSRREDPLAEFYEAAKAERRREMVERFDNDDYDTEDDEALGNNHSQEMRARPKVRGFLCDDPSKSKETDKLCPNEDIVILLEKLAEMHRAKPMPGDFWRTFTYQKILPKLRAYPTRIESYAEAISIPGVGEGTARKIQEILDTGELRRLLYENTRDVEVINLFYGIYGVGRQTAYKWYRYGCETLEDLSNGKNGVQLNEVQELGLKYYQDINTRIPREEAAEIFEDIKKIAHRIDPKLFIDIMGSYRRGKKTVGDIDVLITRPTDDGKTHSGVLYKLLRELRKASIITNDLALPDDSFELEAIYRGLCVRTHTNVPHEKRTRRRIDILCVPWASRGAALIYYTGDDIFNRSLRMKAGVMGYSLNQRGLYAGVIRKPSKRTVKTSPGNIIASSTEEEIFKILGVPWQEPHERIRH